MILPIEWSRNGLRDRTLMGLTYLDGYPRTAVQAEQLEELAAEQGKEIQAIEVDVPHA